MSGNRLTAIISKFFRHLLAPGVCLACGDRLDQAVSLCDACSRRLERIPNPCQYCAEPNPAGGRVCPRCLLNPPRWQRTRIPFHYRGLVRDYLIRVKFDQSLHLAHCLCEQGLAALQDREMQPQALLPVPLYRGRLFERGYNQAEEIASLWSHWLDIPLDRKALTRKRHTPGQSGLSADQRADNVREAFAYAPRIEYRHVAIVDDIVTTGSTVSEIARLLHRHGVEYVEVWALARAYRR